MIDQTFQKDGIKYKASTDINGVGDCTGCAFDDDLYCFEYAPPCDIHAREDKCEIIWIKEE